MYLNSQLTPSFRRCYHLNKQCQPSDSLRKSVNVHRRHQSAATARISGLEGKVDSLRKLLSLVAQSPALQAGLHSAVSQDGNLADYQQLLSQDDPGKTSAPKKKVAGSAKGLRLILVGWISSTANTTILGVNSVTTQPLKANPVPTASPSSSSYAAINNVVDIFASTPLALDNSSTHHLEACLTTFRDKMLPSFPFTNIPPNVTGQQLKHDRPFLAYAIMAVASPSTEQKVLYGRQLKDVLAPMMPIQISLVSTCSKDY